MFANLLYITAATFTCCTLVLLGQGILTITGRGLQTWIFSTAAEIWGAVQPPAFLSATRAESPEEKCSNMTEMVEIVSLLDIPGGGGGQIIPSDVWGGTVQGRLRWDVRCTPTTTTTTTTWIQQVISAEGGYTLTTKLLLYLVFWWWSVSLSWWEVIPWRQHQLSLTGSDSTWRPEKLRDLSSDLHQLLINIRVRVIYLEASSSQ